MAEYSDDRFLELASDLRTAIDEIMDMDGNSVNLVREEVDIILEDYE